MPPDGSSSIWRVGWCLGLLHLGPPGESTLATRGGKLYHGKRFIKEATHSSCVGITWLFVLKEALSPSRESHTQDQPILTQDKAELLKMTLIFIFQHVWHFRLVLRKCQRHSRKGLVRWPLGWGSSVAFALIVKRVIRTRDRVKVLAGLDLSLPCPATSGGLWV